MTKSRIFIIIAGLLLMCSVASIPIFAIDTDALNIDENEQIKAILITVNDVYSEADGGGNITVDDVDFSKAYLIYTDTNTNIFHMPTNNQDEIRNALELDSAPLLVELPIFLDNGDVYILGLAKGYNLGERMRKYMSDEEVAEAKNRAEWHISMYGFLKYGVDTFEDYREIAKSVSGITDREPFFVSNLWGFRGLSALYSDDEGNFVKLVPINVGARSTGEFPKILSRLTDPPPELKDGSYPIRMDVLRTYIAGFEYEVIKQAVNNSAVFGGLGVDAFVVIIVTILIATIVVLVFVISRKRERKRNLYKIP
jgi:hypothetical protein